MKKGWVTLLLMMIAVVAHAQNFNEWFRQKKTQINYLQKQIIALQVFIELGQQGYAIYREGLDLIGDIKDGEFKLHKDYFASLSNVKRVVSQSAQLDEIIAWAQQIRLFEQRVSEVDVGNATNSLRRLFTALAEKSSDQVGQLQLLITDGHYELKDEQRIEHISNVHSDMLRLYSFAKQTYQDAIFQTKELSKQDKEIEIIKQLQGLP